MAASFLDLDGTLVDGETQLGMLLHFMRAGLLPPLGTLKIFGRYALYVVGLTRSLNSIRPAGYALMKGANVDRVRQVAWEYAHGSVAPRLRRRAAALVKSEARLGYRTVLVTSVPEFLAQAIADVLGISDVIATVPEARGTVLTGRIESPSPYGIGKRQLVERYCQQRGINPDFCRAYADHESDLPLLEYVGDPRVVMPTRRLAAIARQRGWPLENLDMA
jgi:HAD superfamily hydrolase (TIGR01490 family)